MVQSFILLISTKPSHPLALITIYRNKTKKTSWKITSYQCFSLRFNHPGFKLVTHGGVEMWTKLLVNWFWCYYKCNIYIFISVDINAITFWHINYFQPVVNLRYENLFQFTFYSKLCTLHTVFIHAYKSLYNTISLNSNYSRSILTTEMIELWGQNIYVGHLFWCGHCM